MIFKKLRLIIFLGKLIGRSCWLGIAFENDCQMAYFFKKARDIVRFFIVITIEWTIFCAKVVFFILKKQNFKNRHKI